MNTMCINTDLQARSQ